MDRAGRGILIKERGLTYLLGPEKMKNMSEEQIKKFAGAAEKFAPYALPVSIIIAGALIASAIYFGGGVQLVPKKQAGGIPQPSTSPSQLPPSGTPPSGTPPEVTNEDHIRGNKDAPVTIVEFSDLQCPFCRRFHPTMQQILQNYPNQVRWVYKHFPLDAIHSEARPAAEASECVWEQKGEDGFWQFVDGVFENQDRIGSALYRELAQQTGVNTAQFEQCVSSRKYQQKVEDQYQQGVAAGVQGTPGSFVNGEEVSGAVPYTQLESVVKRALGQ